MTNIDNIIRLFQERGESQYGGESVTQRQHALQCALLAEKESAPAALITAALLHDIGHLLHRLPADAPDRGVDDSHEDLGCRFLKGLFGDSVAEPVRLHVPAKRFLCSTDSEYEGRLSQPSRVSLELQGGRMSDEEVADFKLNPFADDAVRLRRWDDEAKVVDLETPAIEHFLHYLETALASAGSNGVH